MDTYLPTEIFRYETYKHFFFLFFGRGGGLRRYFFLPLYSEFKKYSFSTHALWKLIILLIFLVYMICLEMSLMCISSRVTFSPSSSFIRAEIRSKYWGLESYKKNKNTFFGKFFLLNLLIFICISTNICVITQVFF